MREEVWQDENGKVVKHNLAYINFSIFSADNGRVLGYDNSHDHHHRHFMGAVQLIEFEGYSTLANRKEDEKNGKDFKDRR